MRSEYANGCRKEMYAGRYVEIFDTSLLSG